MDTGILATAATIAARRLALLDAVRAITPDVVALAARRDAAAEFPAEEMNALRRIGALAAPLPMALAGLGFGIDPAAAVDSVTLLRLVGQASLPLGRVFEGHMNALRLVCRLGTAAQARVAAADARAGHLFGVWNTDPPDTPLMIKDGMLVGAKTLASGAGHVTRALVTAAGEPRPLLLVRLQAGARADLSGWTAQGMRASATGRVTFDGLGDEAVAEIGPRGAYLAQPDFSGGAWRVLAVQLGGLDALVVELRTMLVERGRAGNSHQLARFGQALISRHTAALFVNDAALRVEVDRPNADAVVAQVGLARIAVESACLAAIQLAQRSVGLAAFMRPAPIERICRDLSTYLRQPAPDDTLTEAAAHFFTHGLS